MKRLTGILLLVLAAQVQAASTHTTPTFVFADALIWQLRPSAADNWGQLATGSSSHTLYTVLDAPYGWNTGIRIGVGHEFDQGSYDVTLTYAHYQATATNQARGVVISSFDGNYFANNLDGTALDLPYRSANVKYEFFYHTLDLSLGTSYVIDTVLQFHPYVGLKAAIIDQNIYSNWLGPIGAANFTSATENLKNDFNGIGPSLGVDSAWTLYNGNNQSINLIGNLATALLVGHTTMSDVYSNNQPVTITVYNNSINGVSPMLGAILALQWNKQLAKSSLSIRAGYETQIWFNQVQFYSLNMGKINRPISMQGGNIEFRFNF